MTFKKTCIYLSATVVLLLINIFQLKAQSSPGTPCGDPDVDCPIDSFVILLVAAMLFLSVKKIKAINSDKKIPVKAV